MDANFSFTAKNATLARGAKDFTSRVTNAIGPPSLAADPRTGPDRARAADCTERVRPSHGHCARSAGTLFTCSFERRRGVADSAAGATATTRAVRGHLRTRRKR